MRNNIVLQTENLILENVSLSDCNSIYLSWLNDKVTNQYLESGFVEHTSRSLEEFVLKQINDPTSLFLAIKLKITKKHIGNIKISKIHQFHKTGEYGIMMGDKLELGKGYAKEASIAILDFSFNILKLKKINLGVISENTNAIKLYKKLGFKIEGVLRNNFFHLTREMYLDEIRMGLLKNEFKY